MDALREHWDWFVTIDGPRDLLVGLGYLALLLAGSRLVRLVVDRARRRELAAGAEHTLTRLLFVARRPTEQAILVGGLYFFSLRLPIEDEAHRVVNDGLFLLGVLFLTRAGIAAAGELVDGYARRVMARQSEELDVGVFQLMKKLAILVVWTLALMAGLNRFDVDIMSLVAALGVGSLAIGLAARETLGNMISGLTLLLDRPFREGDRVKLATNEIGEVREIGLRSTRIQLLDLTYLIVPNNELVNQRLVNLTYPSPKVRAAVTLTLTYGSDVAAAKEALLALVRAQPEVLAEPPPTVDVTALGDAGFALEVGFFVGNPRRGGVVAESVRAAAPAALRHRAAALAYPTRTVLVQSGEALRPSEPGTTAPAGR